MLTIKSFLKSFSYILAKISNQYYISNFRVNFLKYQKPEKDLSFIKESETYRMIHNLDRPENGIEKRPERVAAEEDILKVKRLIHKLHASPFPFL